MHTEIITDSLSVEDLWLDLRENIRRMDQMHITIVKCLFGYSWGNFIYSGKWCDKQLALEELESTVLRYEEKKYGRLGDDNLYITIPEFDAKIAYTYETDIHLSYSSTNRFVELILDRWKSDQWLSGGNYK